MRWKTCPCPSPSTRSAIRHGVSWWRVPRVAPVAALSSPARGAGRARIRSWTLAQRRGEPTPLLPAARQTEAQQVGSEVERSNENARCKQTREAFARIGGACEAKQRCAACELEAVECQQIVEALRGLLQNPALAMHPAHVGI